MLRASFAGLLVAIGMNLVLVLLGGLGNPWTLVLTPGLAGGLIAGFIYKRGLLGGLVAGCMMALLMFLWMITVATGIGIPPMYEAVGEFPGIWAVVRIVAPTAALAVGGGFLGGLLSDVLPSWKSGIEQWRSASARSNYYKR